MKPKMRISLLNGDLTTKTDRLIDQYTELLNGPTEQHHGPYKIEVVLWDHDSIDKTIGYINKLRGTLPIEESKLKTPKQNQKVNEHRLVYEALKSKQYMEEVIDYLNEINFRFISPQLIEDYNLRLYSDTPADKLKGYQTMAKVLRYAKDPANDRFDFDMQVYIRFIGKEPSKIAYIYLLGKHKATLVKPWRDSKVNMKEKKIPMVFPKYMSIEERKDWRAIRRRVEMGASITEKKQRFHDRHLKEIMNINPTKFNL